ncbi:MAG TPA: amino acid permease [Thermoanaerobaculia bacterium]|jgi:APA family basic amino acid/polyamine antiporter
MPDARPSPASAAEPPALLRRIGVFDATMIVMGGIIGSGIFVLPSVVARHVGTPAAFLGAWVLGGAIAMAGAFIYAELAWRRPDVGGQYAYLREAYGPVVAFAFGWGLLLVVQTGGMAASAIAAARYIRELSGTTLSDGALAAAALILLTAINCLGVRAGSTTQTVLMLAKIAAILALVAIGLTAPRADPAAAAALAPPSAPLAFAMLAALVPILFAYGGWQTATFVSGEMRNPGRDLPRALILGVLGVITCYVLVSIVCLRVLGPAGLAASKAPASDVMRAALGETGARIIAIGIAISTLGFLSQSMLTAPRVYYAMAKDGLFFRSVGWVHRGTRAPAAAIALQGIFAIVIALSGRYEQILNYVVSVDWIFFGLTAASLFALRRRDRLEGREATGFRVPGHPVTTGSFVLVAVLIVGTTLAENTAHAAIAVGILLAGLPAYFFWKSRRPA